MNTFAMRSFMLVIAAFATTLAVPESVGMAADPAVMVCLNANRTASELEAQHKLRAERVQLAICAADKCPADVRKECLHRLEEVNEQMPTVVFEVKDASGRDLTAVKVTMDGEVVAERLDGSPLALDPGEHAFRFEAPGLPLLTQTTLLRAGDRNRHVPVTFGPPPEAPKPPPVTPAVVPMQVPRPATTPMVVAESSTPSVSTETTAPEPKTPLSTRRKLAISAGSVGLAGIVTGAVFGGLSLSALSTLNGECPSHTHCSQQAFNDRNNAMTYATVSDVGIIAGAVLVAGGVTLWFTAPKEQVPTTGLQIVPGGLRLTGRF
jgi:hypothetical protein